MSSGEILRRIEEEQRRIKREAEEKKASEALSAERRRQEGIESSRKSQERSNNAVENSRRIVESATRQVVSIFEQLKRHPQILRAPKKTIETEIDKKYWNFAKVMLMWGTKFGLTDEERRLIEEYRHGRKSFRTYPSEIEAADFRQLLATVRREDIEILGSDGTVGIPLRTDDFLQDNTLIEPLIASALSSIPEYMPTVKTVLLKEQGYSGAPNSGLLSFPSDL